MRQKPNSKVERQEGYQRIYATIDAIPRGMVASYGAIAHLAGLPGRARLVGRALRILAAHSKLPWHRVVHSSGQIARRGDPGGEREQARRLRAEGVELQTQFRLELARYLWPEARAALESARKRSR